MLLATTPLFHAMGIWAVAMERAFGWNRNQLSLALSFTRVEGGILGPLEGYLIDRFGTRRMILVGMVILGFGWLFFLCVLPVWDMSPLRRIEENAKEFGFVDGLVFLQRCGQDGQILLSSFFLVEHVEIL